MIVGETSRARFLEQLEDFYHNSQYDHLKACWTDTVGDDGAPVSFLQKRPSVVIPLPSLIVDTFTRGLWAAGRRPIPVVKDAQAEDAKELADLVAETQLYRVMREATRRALITGTGVLTWRVVDGLRVVESWDAKFCTPTFKPGCFPQLIALDYVFPFTSETAGKSITMWSRQTITEESWTVYEPVQEVADRDPAWSKDTALSVDHKLGFVPAVWFLVGARSSASPWDGSGIYADLLSLFDDLNRTASQSSKSLFMNLDPQLVAPGMQPDSLDELRKGTGNVWPLPLGADMKLLESNGAYLVSADARITSLRKWCLDAAAIVINDPEKVGGGTQSGTSLELLSAPMIARISELREDVGDGAVRPLLEQMLLHAQPGRPRSVLLHWGSATQTTVDDALTAVQAAAAAVTAGILSRQAAARFVAPYLNVTDVDEDANAIEEEGGAPTTFLRAVKGQ
jgi:hypothetical protein